jgi:23S rRNA pseudouridine1911/1915/1917 synthase
MKKIVTLLPEILYEDKYLLVVNKPSGLIVQGAKKDEDSLLYWLKKFIKERDEKPGNVFLGVVHRLDKPVSGALILAKRSKVAKKLFESFQKGEIIKVYLAKVKGLFQGEGIWEDYLFWDEKKRKTLVLYQEEKRAKKALTLYKTLYSSNKETYLLLSPITGRKHQIRAILSARGHPVIGDFKYGDNKKIKKGGIILLHALFLDFPHPMTGEKIDVWARVPDYFNFKLPKKVLLNSIKRMHKYLNEVKYREIKNLG